ncbi:MAG: hypothetical protein JWM96_1216 [Alphaproteobacteria bacterium]|nr:hypothetical protein [Alphaproteobacteria bacterium]
MSFFNAKKDITNKKTRNQEEVVLKQAQQYGKPSELSAGVLKQMEQQFQQAEQLIPLTPPGMVM